MIQIDTAGLVYYSYLDEANFFKWAEELDCVVSLENGVLHIDRSTLTESNLRDLLALLTRYDLPANQLASLLSEENGSWFGAPDTYWHLRVFKSA